MRIASGPLVEKRRARSSRILVTGAAGFLGSHIAVALLEAGFPVAVLVRSSKTLAARDRIARPVEASHGWQVRTQEKRQR